MWCWPYASIRSIRLRPYAPFTSFGHVPFCFHSAPCRSVSHTLWFELTWSHLPVFHVEAWRCSSLWIFTHPRSGDWLNHAESVSDHSGTSRQSMTWRWKSLWIQMELADSWALRLTPLTATTQVLSKWQRTRLKLSVLLRYWPTELLYEVPSLLGN